MKRTLFVFLLVSSPLLADDTSERILVAIQRLEARVGSIENRSRNRWPQEYGTKPTDEFHRCLVRDMIERSAEKQPDFPESGRTVWRWEVSEKNGEATIDKYIYVNRPEQFERLHLASVTFRKDGASGWWHVTNDYARAAWGLPIDKPREEPLYRLPPGEPLKFTLSP